MTTVERKQRLISTSLNDEIVYALDKRAKNLGMPRAELIRLYLLEGLELTRRNK